MKKCFMITAVLMLLCTATQAQELKYGIHVGTNTAKFHSGKSYIVYDSKSKSGFQIGGDLSYTLKNNVTLSSGLDALTLGGRFSTMSNYIGTGGTGMTEHPEINTKEMAFEIPLTIGYKFNLGSKSYIIPSIGIYGRYSFASFKENVVTMTDYEKNTTITEKWNCFENYSNSKYPNMNIQALKRFDLGINIGVKAVVTEHYSISVCYSNGFLKRSDTYDIKNQDLRISLGYEF